MKITNFTQDGGTDRAVVEVTLPGDTENGGTTNVLTATRIDFSTGSNAENFPEIGNRVTIAGPARVRIRPIVGAKLFITYKKERDEGSGGGAGRRRYPIAASHLQSTPGVTPSPTFNPFSLQRPDGGQPVSAPIAFHSSGVNFSLAAATFSSKCARYDARALPLKIRRHNGRARYLACSPWRVRAAFWIAFPDGVAGTTRPTLPIAGRDRARWSNQARPSS